MTKPKTTETPVVAGQPGLYHALQVWTQEISQHLPSLSAPQARVLALWSVDDRLRECGESGKTLVRPALELSCPPTKTLSPCLRLRNAPASCQNRGSQSILDLQYERASVIKRTVVLF